MNITRILICMADAQLKAAATSILSHRSLPRRRLRSCSRKLLGRLSVSVLSPRLPFHLRLSCLPFLLLVVIVGSPISEFAPTSAAPAFQIFRSRDDLIKKGG